VTIEPPRVYNSFAEFERDERERLGLEALPDPGVEVARAASPVARAARTQGSVSLSAPLARSRSSVGHAHVTPEALRAEGVLEVGCATGTSVLYVLTRAKLHLLHVTWVPDRQLDDYAVALAMNWIEGHGMPSYEVASNLGVSESTLRQALLAAGHERATTAAVASKRSERARRGNRRGRFMRRVSASASA